jgi:hypothetical protein
VIGGIGSWFASLLRAPRPPAPQVALFVVQEPVVLGAGNHCLTVVGDGLNHSFDKLPVAPGPFLSEQRSELGNGVERFVIERLKSSTASAGLR